YFVRDHPADLIALALTLFAATRFGLLPTVAISMVSAAVLRILIV
ncbi:MAG: AzlD family protein, partial [Acinetobacter sp.]